jgi:hypothetical protein
MKIPLRLTPARLARPLALAIAFSAGTFVSAGSPVFAQSAPAAQQAPDADDPGPMENSQPLTGTLPEVWDSAWDSGTFDRRHYIIGTVAAFTSYRLSVARANGETTQIDLKKGTVGLNLTPGERVAVIGYWSKGTFIANRIVLRSA